MFPPSSHRFLRRASLSLALLLLAACGGSGGDGDWYDWDMECAADPAEIAPGGTSALRVEIRLNDGAWEVPTPITWRITPPLGIVSPNPGESDTHGKATAVFTAGSEPGIATLVAETGIQGVHCDVGITIR